MPRSSGVFVFIGICTQTGEPPVGENCVARHSVRVTIKRNAHKPIPESEVEDDMLISLYSYVCIVCVCMYVHVCMCDTVFKHIQCT